MLSAAQGRLQSHNIVRFQPEPTLYSTSRVATDNLVSSFQILFDKLMLRNMKNAQLKKVEDKLETRLGT